MFLRSVAWIAVFLSTIAVHPGAAAPRRTIRLTDQRGRTFAFSSLRGAPLVLTFVSAHCSDACPILEAEIARSVERTNGSPVAMRFLTLTLDPERDTARDMQRLARQFEAKPARWIFATGSPSDIHILMKRYAVETQRDRYGFASAHTSFVYLLDSHLALARTLLPSGDLSTQLIPGNFQR